MLNSIINLLDLNENLMILGGFALSKIIAFESENINLFVKCRDLSEFRAIVAEKTFVLLSAGYNVRINEDANNLIKISMSEIKEVLIFKHCGTNFRFEMLNFDIHVCRVSYDGITVEFFDETTQQMIKSRDTFAFVDTKAERIRKYTLRGFNVFLIKRTQPILNERYL